MFDISYETEASITAAFLMKERTWKKVLDCDLSKPFGPVFMLMQSVVYYEDVLTYLSIMYYTHGV